MLAAYPLAPVAAVVVVGLIAVAFIAVLDRVYPGWYMD